MPPVPNSSRLRNVSFCQQTPGGTTTGIFASRIALAEKNPPTANDTGFSQTTVSSAVPSEAVKEDTSEEASLDSVGPYQDFAVSIKFVECLYIYIYIYIYICLWY